MALYKEIRQEDGVITNYHRILYIHNTINKQSSIAVLSYVDSAARMSEQQKNITITPYQKGIVYERDYDETMTPEKAYEFLKTLPVFVGAEDV